MNQAGTLGFSPRNSRLAPGSIFVTNPLSPRVRVPSTDRTMLPFPGGFLMHTGLPNAGWKSIRRTYTAHWAQSTVSVWVHVISVDLSELAAIVRDCEELDGIAAIELGLPPGCSRDDVSQMVQAARGEIPLVLHISAGEDLCLLKSLPAAVSAVTLGTPRGMLPLDGKMVHGRLHGPGLFPVMLETLQNFKGLPVPLILGGICNAADGKTALQCGAAAVQMDMLCWNGPLPDSPK
jgi:hypothetical protein